MDDIKRSQGNQRCTLLRRANSRYMALRHFLLIRVARAARIYVPHYYFDYSDCLGSLL